MMPPMSAPSPLQTTLVIGAGVVGLSVALQLRRAGVPATVLDPLPPGEGGASWGNSGIISAALVAPLSQGGAWREVPRWLADPLGPLAIRPGHLPRAAPWLWRWMRSGAGGLARAEAISDAIQALHRDAYATWRDMLGEAGFAARIRQLGQVVGFESPPAAGAPGFDQHLRARHGVAAEPLDRAALERIFPGIAPSVLRGLRLPGQGHMPDPGATLRLLAERLREAGGEIRAERVLRLLPEGGAWRVLTNLRDHAAPRVVMAAGIWSKPLLAPLGVRLPLLAERGYHAELPAIDIPMPITFRARGLALTPMAGRLRASGTVEIAAADAPPDPRRGHNLAVQARRLFPGIPPGEPVLWMGPRPGLPDGLPAIGAAGPPGLFLCCGHGHFGMTSGPPSARALARLMLGEAPGLDLGPYAPGRFG
jgi:D-amino-acid dehydrogenase